MTESPSSRTTKAAALILAASLAIFSIWIDWTGYVESDDLAYADAAEAWIAHAPFLGVTHWAIRHVIVLPMAMIFRLFGRSETTLVAPSVFYTAAVILLLAHIAWRLRGPAAAAIVIAIVGTIPAVAESSTLVSTDMPEAFFVILSVWLYDRARAHGSASLFLASGAAAGFAAITRETTVALLILYAILLLSERGRNARAMLLLAAGFAAIVFADWIYLYSLSGDPLYRLHVAKAATVQDGPQMAAQFRTAPGVDRFGSLAVPSIIKPVATLLLNQNYGLFFWLAAPAAILQATRKSAPAILTLLPALAATWLVVLGYVLGQWLWIIPRYFLVCIVVGVPLALTFDDARHGRRRLIAAAALLVLVSSNLALSAGSTTDLMAGEHALVALARQSPVTLHTDPSTALGAAWLLENAGLSGKVSDTPPQRGDIYVYNSRPHRALPANWPIQTPPPDWVLLSRSKPRTKWTAIFVQGLGLQHILPAGVVRKLDPPPHVLATYRVGG